MCGQSQGKIEREGLKAAGALGHGTEVGPQRICAVGEAPGCRAGQGLGSKTIVPGRCGAPEVQPHPSAGLFVPALGVGPVPQGVGEEFPEVTRGK